MAAGAAALAVVVLAILITTRGDGRAPSSLAKSATEQEPAAVTTTGPEQSTTTELTVPPTTVGTTTTAAAPIRTTTTPATSGVTAAPVTPAPRVTPAPATWSGAMNGISMSMRVEPGVVVGGRQLVQFGLEMSSATPGCCRASVRFSDGVSAGVLPSLSCPSTTTATSASTSRRFTEAGAYTATLVASTCPSIPSSTGPPVELSRVTAELVVCLRIVLDGSGSSSSSAGPCA